MPSPVHDNLDLPRPPDDGPPHGERLDDGLDDPRVLAALKEFVAATEAGRAPGREQFLAAHADIAAPLSQCLDSLNLVWAAAPRLRTLAGEGLSAARPLDLPAALGDFRIIRELGRGGMGIVYEAEQLSLARRVALKVLPFASALDVTRLQRFKNEAQAAAQLHHTNIVPVYAVGCDRGVHFYAMQLIEGKTLASVILEMRHTVSVPLDLPGQAASQSRDTDEWPAAGSAQTGARHATAQSASLHLPHRETVQAVDTAPFSKQLSDERKSGRAAFYQTVARLGVQAAEALEHAHQMGVVHRDIKPGNLLIDARGKLWVTDFGLAQFHDVGGLTITGNLPGTIRYMSPEQATGQRVVLDHRTDIYSLGITLYELVTLRPAFDDADGRLLVRHIAAEEPPAPRTIDRAIPADLETILLKAMAKAPGDRYASAQALADDLQRFLEHQPIRARRPRPLERLAKWARRHKPLVAAAVLGLFIAAIGFLASTVIIAREHTKTKLAYQREIEQRAAAERSFQQARQAVDTFTQLGEEELAMKPGSYQLRRKFLAAALDYYETFLEQHRDDPAVQAELAASRSQVARIVEEISVLSRLGPLMLLSDDRVQAELDISPEQRVKFETLIDQLGEQRWPDGHTLPDDLDPADRQHELVALLRSYEDQFNSIVGPQQIERLRQLSLQQQGPFAFRRAEVIDALALSPQQRKQITEILEAHAPHHGRRIHQIRDDSDGLRKPPSGPRMPPRDHHDDRFFDFAGGGPKGPPPRGKSNNRFEPADTFERDAAADPTIAQGPPSNDTEEDLADRHDRRPKPGRPEPHSHEFGDHRHGPGGPFGPHDRMRETMNETVADIVKIFTPEQLATWQNMVGEPVSFEMSLSPGEMFFW